MPFDRAALEALAESVGDGAPVDWAAVEAQATDDQRPVVRQLRVLESLAHLHRTLPPVEQFTTPQFDRSSSSPAIGSWGHLSLLERLGGGTFGDVYRAWDAQLEREVALKLLRGDAPDSSRLIAEGRLLAKVRHEHVVRVYGVGTHEDRVGLWMELVRGVTLEHVLGSKGLFDATEAAQSGINLCRALTAIHDAGVVHRDVKAQNVVREDNGRIVLMDLGTGRDLARGDSAVGVAGTPLYLAPEIFAGVAASPRSDIYSLGVLLYHLVTGEYPVRAASFNLLKQAHASRQRAPLRERRPDLPKAFVSAVDRALEPNPADRYPSAAEFDAALVRALEPPAGHDRRRFGLVLAAFAVVVFLVAGWSAIRPGARLAPRSATAATAAAIKTIAVLPFRNDSGDRSRDYFSDGMTDEIISTLGQIGNINVISRTSTAQFRGMQHNGVAHTLPEIGRALHADTIVEGSIALSGGGASGAEKVRINARLIAAGTDTQIWNKTFEALAGDVATLKGQVAQAIADGIRLRLSPEQQGAIAGAQRHQPDFEAYSLLLQGRAAWSVRTKPSIERSIDLFQQAIARDPLYAAPHAGLSDAYSLLSFFGWIQNAEGLAKSADEAAKALALDDSLSEAHVSMARVHDSRFEWDAAEASYRRAIALNPGNVSAHHWYGLVLSKRGAFPEATAEVERARSLDPLSPTLSTQLASFQIQQGNNDDAIARLERIVEDQPAFTRGHYILAQAYAHAGRYDRARAETDRTAALGGDSPELRSLVGCIRAASGQTAEAQTSLADLIARYQNNREGGPTHVATLYAALGDVDRAFEWLERARTEHDPMLSYLRVDPWLVPLHDDPRYQRLLATLGLTR